MGVIDWGDLEALKRQRPALVLETLTDGDADAFKRAIDEGFDVNIASDYGGSERTPLHHAAAGGDIPAMKYLLDHGAGASLGVSDPSYNATPLGWAEFFEQPEAADFLRNLSS